MPLPMMAPIRMDAALAAPSTRGSSALCSFIVTIARAAARSP
jgi:hypothetical protein